MSLWQNFTQNLIAYLQLFNIFLYCECNKVIINTQTAQIAHDRLNQYNTKSAMLSVHGINLIYFLQLSIFFQICGAVVIFDMDGLSLQQAWQFTPPFAKRIVDLLQDAIALRIKAIHVVDQPKIFNMVFALFKPFLREKLRNRIHFHGTDRTSLHEHLSPKYLPAKYGGHVDVPDVSGAQWLQVLLMCDPEYEGNN